MASIWPKAKHLQLWHRSLIFSWIAAIQSTQSSQTKAKMSSPQAVRKGNSEANFGGGASSWGLWTPRSHETLSIHRRKSLLVTQGPRYRILIARELSSVFLRVMGRRERDSNGPNPSQLRFVLLKSARRARGFDSKICLQCGNDYCTIQFDSLFVLNRGQRTEAAFKF